MTDDGAGRASTQIPAADDGGVAERLRTVHDRIAAAEVAAGRPVGSVRLLLATKTVPAPLIRAALVAAPIVYFTSPVSARKPKPDAAWVGVDWAGRGGGLHVGSRW